VKDFFSTNKKLKSQIKANLPLFGG